LTALYKPDILGVGWSPRTSADHFLSFLKGRRWATVSYPEGGLFRMIIIYLIGYVVTLAVATFFLTSKSFHLSLYFGN